MKYVELYVKESHRLSMNPLNERATQFLIGAFVIAVALTTLVKVMLTVLHEAKLI